MWRQEGLLRRTPWQGTAPVAATCANVLVVKQNPSAAPILRLTACLPPLPLGLLETLI